MTILSRRSGLIGLMLLLGCLQLNLMTAFPAAASDVKLVNTSAPLKDYAELGFTLPTNVAVETETLNEVNYTSGREVRASLLLNGSRVVVHLLYPCQAPQSMLDAAAMKSLLEAYNSDMAQASYSNETLAVGGMPAVGGMVGNQIFVAYQPTNQTPALVQLDSNMSDENLVAFLQYLRITVKEGASPLTAGYCPDSTATTAPAQVSTESTATNNVAAGPAAQTPAEVREATFEAKKEKMAADMEAAKEKLAAAKEKMRGF